MNEKMEILYCEYCCKNCGVGVENIRSVHLDVPCKLDVACPECNQQNLVLVTENRMVQNEDEKNE